MWFQIIVIAFLASIFTEVLMAAVTVSSILTAISALNTEVQAIRDALTANPVASQSQLSQINDNVAVVQTNLDGLKTQLGV